MKNETEITIPCASSWKKKNQKHLCTMILSYLSKIWAPCLNIVCISLTLILCLHLYYTAPMNASPFELKLSHIPFYMLHTVDPAFVLLPMLVNFLWSCSSHIYFIQVHQTSLISLLIKLLMRETT